MTNAIRWGSTFLLDSDSGSTFDSAIAGLSTGKLSGAVTLEPSGEFAFATRAQLLDASGFHQHAEFDLNPGATGNQMNSAIVGLSNGGFVIAWTDWSAQANVLAQVFDSDFQPTGTPFALSNAGDWRDAVQLAARPEGGFVAIFESHNDQAGEIDDIVRIFNADGTSVPGFGVNSSIGDHPDVAVLTNGNIVAAWDGPDSLRAHIFDPTGNSLAEEFAVTGAADDDAQDVQLVALKDGGFAAVWAMPKNSEDTDIHLQMFDASGHKRGSDVLVNTISDRSQFAPQVAQIADGRLAVTWSTGWPGQNANVELQLINLDGTKSGDELVVNARPDSGQTPNVTALADGRLVVSWHDRPEQGGFSDELAQIFDPREGAVHLTGTPFNDDYYGTAFDDSIKGLAGDDRFDGGAGNDTAEYTGYRYQYQIVNQGDHFEVRGPEGTDTLYSVEYLKFADVTVTIGSVPPQTTPPADPPPSAPPPDPPASPPSAPPPHDADPYIVGLFDTRYYLTHNGDVSAAKVSGIDHFNGYGWHEGRAPNAFFDTALYLAFNKDVAASGVNPLTEYHQGGWREGRDPGPNFDNKLYLAHNPDVAASGADPLEHYLQHGMAEGRAIYAAIGGAVHGFDAEWYVFHNPDVAAAGVDPLQHYEQFGWREGRNPNGWFDAKGYLAHYADVAAAGIDPLMHYETAGWKEGRDASTSFSTSGYLAANTDVAAAHINPLDHFINSGIYEGRIAVADGWH